MQIINHKRLFQKKPMQTVGSVEHSSPPQGISQFSAKTLIVVLCVSVSMRVLGFFMPEYERLFMVFSFFSTFVHEEFHCLSSYLVQGQCLEFTIHRNLGGHALVITRLGEFGIAIIAAAGLLGPAIMGSFLMIFGSNPAYRVLSWLCLVLMVAISFFFLKGSFAISATVVMVLTLLLIGACGKNAQYFLINITGTQLHLASFDDWDYMFSHGFIRHGQYWLSDSQKIAEAFAPHHYLFWGVAIALFSLVLLIISIRAALSNLSKEVS